MHWPNLVDVARKFPERIVLCLGTYITMMVGKENYVFGFKKTMTVRFPVYRVAVDLWSNTIAME